MNKNDLENNFSAVVQLIEQDISQGNFQTTKTEDFFLRVLSTIYDLPSLQNLAYDKVNTEAIDLIDRSRRLGIQITAQKSNEKGKIDHTIDGTLKYWKNEGLNKVWIFFITETNYLKKNIDTTKPYTSIDGIDFYIKTVNRLIGDTNKSPLEKRLRLTELLKQESSGEYSGLHSLNLFRQIKKGEPFIYDNFFNHKESIYLTEKELKTIKYITKGVENGSLKDYCILGNPCSGKTTIGYSICQKIQTRKIFYLDLSNPNIQMGFLNQDITQISHNYSLLVIDNIHENIEIFKRLKEKVAGHAWISTLYLSRYYKTFDEYDLENIYKLIEGIPYYRIDKHEDFNEKVSGIIKKRINRHIKSDSSIIWRKGDFRQILKNTNNNLLKLNIALRLWEKKNKADSIVSLDKIDSNKILQQFYEEHEIDDIKSDALYIYTLLFKNDIPFIPMRNYVKENRTLREKGIILQYFNSDFTFFPHREYALLIWDSLNYINGTLSNTEKSNLLLDYIEKFETEENSINICLTIIQLNKSVDNEIIPSLINSSKVNRIISEEIRNEYLHPFQVDQILLIVFQSFELLERELTSSLFESFLTYYKTNHLSLYVYDDYMTYTRLEQLNQLLFNCSLSDTVHKTLRVNEVANTNSIVELTHRIGRKKSPETVSRILHSFDFPTWLEKINSLKKLSNITNSLSELNKSTETRKLLIGLIRNIDWDKLIDKSVQLKTDQFCKSVRELQKIDYAIGTSISKKIFFKAVENNFIDSNLDKAELSEYCKSVSDLSKLNPDYVKKRISTDFRNGLIKTKFLNENSVSNFTARAIEIRKLFNNTHEYFSIIAEITSTDRFKKRLNSVSDLNHLLIYYEFQKTYLSYSSSEIVSYTKDRILDLITRNSNTLQVLSNPKILNLEEITSGLIKNVKPSDIQLFFTENKFTYSEDLFRVLTSINKAFTIDLFQKVSNSVVQKALQHKELNFSQALEDLNKLKNKLYKDESLNCNSKISTILDQYLVSHIASESSYNKLGITDYIKGFYYGWLMSPSVIKKHCETELKNRLNTESYKVFNISPLFQSIRFLSKSTDNYYESDITSFLNRNKHNIIDTIKNEDIDKTLSALSELRQIAAYSNFITDILLNSKKAVITKMRQKKKERIYQAKLLPDLRKLANEKTNSIIRELEKSP
ncbi:SMEK domain-containing protein [Algoriphagus sediminis]|uniref:SMEK domain-containing protein n=1 Tax=Algoriphagus sediminis TaxID=3057113 RepID=A0ABT7Y9X5_9BACT|nr:SMEK domain-containing protein [Algoriphagus sediminis]MDN3203220.1 SMEK domain-containing protein [Algoriphagus sediminis]